MSYEQDIVQRAFDSAHACMKAAKELRQAACDLQFAGPSEIEVRFDGKRLDEVVAKNVSVHLEDMGGSWSLIVESADGKRVMVSLTSRKGIVVESECDVKEVRSP